MNHSLLQKLGLSQKEVRLYIKLLQLGESSAHALARRMEENRTSTYSLLQSLQKKGVISFFVKRGVKFFVPEDPQKLIAHFMQEAQGLQKLLPELLAIYNRATEKPKITFYEGVNGIKQICETLLEVPGSTRESFMGVDEKTIHPEIKRYFEEEFIDRRIGLGITYRGIITGYLPMGAKHQKTMHGQLRELKYIDPKKFPLRIHVDIFPRNKIAIYSYNKDEMMGVIIEHESFFITMKTVFKLAWLGVDTILQP